MSDVALITTLFDYPEDWKPPFLNGALKYFKEKDIKILRYNNVIKSDSYYEKLYHHKIIELLNYLKREIEGKYTYILYMDATDTNFYGNPTIILDKFKNINKSIIFCAEKGLWPPTQFNHLYDKKPKLSDICYLNSGLYFGYVDKIILHLEKIIEDKLCIDDQGAWAIEYLTNDDIIIDQKCELFFSTYNNKNFVNLENNKVTFNDISPVIIHDNGPWNEETLKLTEILKTHE